MKLRYADELAIKLMLSEELADFQIPPMLFIIYIENAFKHGVSYQQESFINVICEKRGNKLYFSCSNSRQSDIKQNSRGGLGLINNEKRLNLLYGDNYLLTINQSDKIYNVSLEIPLI
jgi:LytS/YehU family sensor histidine kinase